jgi:hypothetical protein
MTKHTRAERRRRLAAFKAFVKANPPEMPSDFSNKDYKRVVKYACVAFVTGWNSGINDVGQGQP